jgi:hypothetical protein
MSFNYEQERSLEFKYQGVLDYPEAEAFLKNTPYTAAKINGAIKRSGLDLPKNFIEMEDFVTDLADFWLDANPEVHTDGEKVLYRALRNYVAYAKVWKAKSKSSSIFDPTLMGKCGVATTVKNSLGCANKMINSCAARNPNINREEIAKGLVLGYTAIMSISKGKDPVPEIPDDITRLIGAYMAGDKIALRAAEQIKMIEHK